MPGPLGWAGGKRVLHGQLLLLNTSVSAVYSSKIEGEEIELDSFIKHRRGGVKYRADYTRKIDDLYDAY